MKKCNTCGIEYPKTTEYYYRKKIKQKLADGSIAIYDSYRSDCKTCCNKKNEDRRIKKRCEEMNCDISEYRKKWKEQYSRTRTKCQKISHLPRSIRASILKKIKKGYVFTTYEQYKIDCRSNISKARRKYDYGEVCFVSKEDKSKSGIVNLTDSYVAMSMRIPVDEAPKELIEVKRNILKLKRELKNNNVKIR